MHFCRTGRKHVQSFKKTGLQLYEKLQSQGTHCLYMRSENDKVQKVTKIWQGLYEKRMHIFRLWRKHVQSSKKISIKLYEELCSRGTHCPYILRVKNDKVHKVEKSKKNNLTITSKSHAHPHTMKKSQAKFHNNRYKTVRGVALTRCTNCFYIKGEKWLSSQCGKSDKK